MYISSSIISQQNYILHEQPHNFMTYIPLNVAGNGGGCFQNEKASGFPTRSL